MSQLIFSLGNAAGFELLHENNQSSCVCSGARLSLECTVSGGIGTVFHGDIFDCSSTSDEIVLLHSRLSLEGNKSRSCNNGAIRGQSVGIVNSSVYISRLHIIVSNKVINGRIYCYRDNGFTTTLIGNLTLPILDVIDSKLWLSIM